MSMNVANEVRERNDFERENLDNILDLGIG